MNIDIEYLQNLLNEASANDEEDCCQLAVYQNGELVADICSGGEVKSDSLFPVFSVGKGLVATLALMLYEEGKLDFDAPVSKYWQEFACNGKENTKVWMIFSHRAGLYDMPVLKSFKEQTDWQKMVQYFSTAVPAMEPGTYCRYHGVTFAWLAGEIISRAGGKSFQELFREKITEPLGITDEFFFGITSEAENRYVGTTLQEYWNWFDFRQVFIGDPAIRAACIPSANGIGSARAVARVYAALTGNGVDGVKLLKDETIEYAIKSRRADYDPLPDDPGKWAHFGLGYALAGGSENPSAVFGHGGALGSEGLVCPAKGIAVGFTKNKFNSTHPVHPLRDRISEALGLPIRHW